MDTWTIADMPEWVRPNIAVDGASGCFRVGAGNGISLNSDGYAMRRGAGVHRTVYLECVGEILPGLVIDHVLAWGCVWRNCALPSHLQPVTTRTNILRGTSFAAINAVKDECDNGHPFDLLNTYWRPGNLGRDCRVCIRDRVRKYQQTHGRKRKPAIGGQAGLGIAA